MRSAGKAIDPRIMISDMSDDPVRIQNKDGYYTFHISRFNEKI